jgi:hypothetical protein
LAAFGQTLAEMTFQVVAMQKAPANVWPKTAGLKSRAD